MKRYVTQEVVYQDYSGIDHVLDFEKCLIWKKESFLLENFDKNNNETSPFTICVNYNPKLLMGLIPDYTVGRVGTPNIMYQITKCRNSSENNFSCASDDEIKNMLPYVSTQISIPKTIFDFKNYQNPRTRSYDYQYYFLDFGSFKNYMGRLIPVYLYTDQGIINDDYVLDSLDFNEESLIQQSQQRTNDQDAFFNYLVIVGTNKQTYYRKNYKLMDVISNFGGTINIYFLVGQLICASFNHLLLKYRLINILFENLEEIQYKK